MLLFNLAYCLPLLWFICCLGQSLSSRSQDQTTRSLRSHPDNNITRNLLEAPKYELCFMTKVNLLSHLYSCRLAEWIQFHLIIGVQHFYILDDCSPKESNLKKTLQPFIDQKIVTLIHFQDETLCASESKTTRIIFDTYARNNCDWVGNIDMDEFIYYRTNDLENKHDIKVYLRTLTNQVGHRLVWWIIGGDNHETRPPGLVIESYFHGWFEPAHIKTIARTKYIDSWSFQLHPFYKKDLLIPDTLGLHYKSFYETSRAHPSEYFILEHRHRKEIMPISNLFLFHYRFYSWEEYKQQKGALNKTAGGGMNNWKENPRGNWLAGERMETRLSPNVPLLISPLVRQGLSEFNNTNEYPIFSICYQYWSNDAPIQPMKTNP